MWMNIQDQTITLSEQLAESMNMFFGFGSVFFLAAAAFMVALAGMGILYMITIIAPGTTERCSSTLRESNALSFLVGVPVGLVMAIVAGAASARPGLAAILGVVFGSVLLVGWTSASEDIGRRLFWISGREGTRASHLAAGWMVFVFASFFPVLGWFVIMPYVTFSGLGSLVVSAFRPPKPAPYLRRPPEKV